MSMPKCFFLRELKGSVFFLPLLIAWGRKIRFEFTVTAVEGRLNLTDVFSILEEKKWFCVSYYCARSTQLE